MLETKSAITLALACCLLSALSPAASQPPTASIHLELSLRRFATHKTDSIEFNFRIGTQKGTASFFSQRNLRSLTQSFEFVRESARELYCKRRHMA